MLQIGKEGIDMAFDISIWLSFNTNSQRKCIDVDLIVIFVLIFTPVAHRTTVNKPKTIVFAEDITVG